MWDMAAARSTLGRLLLPCAQHQTRRTSRSVQYTDSRCSRARKCLRCDHQTSFRQYKFGLPFHHHPCRLSISIISDCFFLSCAVSACTAALVPSEIVSSATGVRRNTFILSACHASPQTFLSRIGRQRQGQDEGKGTQEKQRDFPRIVRPTRVACLSLL